MSSRSFCAGYAREAMIFCGIHMKYVRVSRSVNCQQRAAGTAQAAGEFQCVCLTKHTGFRVFGCRVNESRFMVFRGLGA